MSIHGWPGSTIVWKGGPDFARGIDPHALSVMNRDVRMGIRPPHFFLAEKERNAHEMCDLMIQFIDTSALYIYNPNELMEIAQRFFPMFFPKIVDIFFKGHTRDQVFKKYPDLLHIGDDFNEDIVRESLKKALATLTNKSEDASLMHLDRSFIFWFYHRLEEAERRSDAAREIDNKIWAIIKHNNCSDVRHETALTHEIDEEMKRIINKVGEPLTANEHNMFYGTSWNTLRSSWTRFQLWKENCSNHPISDSTKTSSSTQHAPPPTQHHESLSMDHLAAQQEREAFDEQSRFQEAYTQRREKEFAAQEKILVKQREEQLKQEKILEKKALEQKEQQLKQEKILEKKAADLVAEQKKAATLAEKQRLEEKLRKEKLEAAAEKERRLLIAREEENLKEEKKRIEMLQKEELKRTEMLQKEELRLKAEAHAKEMGELAIKTEAYWREHKIRQYQETWSEMHREERERREKAEQKIKEEAQRKKIAEERKIIEENEKREKQKLKEEKDRIYEIKKTNDESKGKQLKVFEENLKTSFTEEIIRGIEAQSEETMENFIKETKEKVQADIKEMREGYTVVRSRDTALKSNQTAAIKIIDDLYEKWKENKKSTKKDAIEMIESREKEIRDEIVKTKKYGEDLLTYLGKSFDELIKNVEKLKLSVKDKEELLEKARSNFQVIADSFAPDSTIQKIITDISEINDLADLKRYLNDLSSKTNNSLHHHLKQLLHKDGGTNIKLLVDKLKEKTGSEANWLVSTDGIFLDTVELSKQNMKEQQEKKNKKKALAKQNTQEHPSAAYVAQIYTGNEKADREREQSESMLKTATKLPINTKKEPEIEPKRDESLEKVRTTTSTKNTLGGKMKNMSKKNNKRTMNRFKIVRKINKNSKRKMNRFTKNRRKRSIKNKRSIYRNFIFSRNIF